LVNPGRRHSEKTEEALVKVRDSARAVKKGSRTFTVIPMKKSKYHRVAKCWIVCNLNKELKSMTFNAGGQTTWQTEHPLLRPPAAQLKRARREYTTPFSIALKRAWISKRLSYSFGAEREN
jgi:hypothetical protein